MSISRRAGLDRLLRISIKKYDAAEKAVDGLHEYQYSHFAAMHHDALNPQIGDTEIVGDHWKEEANEETIWMSVENFGVGVSALSEAAVPVRDIARRIAQHIRARAHDELSERILTE